MTNEEKISYAFAISIKNVKMQEKLNEDEANIIKGLNKIIQLNNPILLFEVNAINHDSGEIISELKKLGYKFFYSPQIKYYDIKPNILKYFLRIVFDSKIIMVNIDQDFYHFAPLAIASFEDLNFNEN